MERIIFFPKKIVKQNHRFRKTRKKGRRSRGSTYYRTEVNMNEWINAESLNIISTYNKEQQTIPLYNKIKTYLRLQYEKEFPFPN